MSESALELRIDGLTPLQAAELKTALASVAEGAISEQASPALPGGRHGEPTLITVAIVLGPSVISALALWLAKQKGRRTETLRYTKKTPKGEETVEFDRSSY